MNKKNSLIVLLVFFNFSLCFSQTMEVYYPWDNDLRKLSQAEFSEEIPLLLNGSNYRIVKIKDFKGRRINKFAFKANNTKIEAFELPIIKNYQNNNILDLMIPLSSNMQLEGNQNDRYFLFKFIGTKPGRDVANLTITSDQSTYSVSLKTKTATLKSGQTMNLNVWSYFNYNYLVDNAKRQVIDDLVSHKVTALVIPPYVLPTVYNLSQEKLNQLRSYVQGTENKFQYYMLYFGGFHDRENDFMSAQWKKKFPIWYKQVTSVLNSVGIKNSQIVLYPIDEPNGVNVRKVQDIYSYARGLGINNKFFVTLSNVGSENLASFVEIVQVHSDIPNLINKVNSYKKPSTEIWIYETKFGSARSNTPLKYLGMGAKAYNHSAKGIGIWAYADVKTSMDNNNLRDFNRGVGTWNITPSKKYADYSLIYRRNNVIYSSLRWEALEQGMEENYWLKLYGNKIGKSQASKMSNKILSNRFNSKEWETIKLNLIQ